MSNYFAVQLEQLKEQSLYRHFPDITHQGKWIYQDHQKMLNLSSNDYLGLGSDVALQAQFLKQSDLAQTPLTSSSSRLLTGNFEIYQQLEDCLAQQFGRPSALIFNSGYHANIGILPAIADKHTLILADKLVHASLIDGIRLSEAKYFRFRHNDYEHLTTLLDKYSGNYEKVIIVTESLFSMDGDYADLMELIEIKRRYKNIWLYVDEAHAVGVLGKKGLGLAEQLGCIQQIDFLVGTFGKALASMGAYLICDQEIKQFLINKMRPLIFSTAIPPLQAAWTHFVLQQLDNWQDKREHIFALSEKLRQAIIRDTQQPIVSQSHIVPWIIGDNQQTLTKARKLQQQGFYCLPIRPPTVPQGQSRIRISITADITHDELDTFIQILRQSSV